MQAEVPGPSPLPGDPKGDWKWILSPPRHVLGQWSYITLDAIPGVGLGIAPT